MPIDKIARFGELVKRFLLATAYKSFLKLSNVCEIFIYLYFTGCRLFFRQGEVCLPAKTCLVAATQSPAGRRLIACPQPETAQPMQSISGSYLSRQLPSKWKAMATLYIHTRITSAIADDK